MPPRTSQKRRDRSSSIPSADAAAKKTRFVEPSDDPTNFAEQVDSALEDPQANRKGRVRNEGYDSDSSDDGEGVVLSRKEKEEEEEEEDMFNIKDEPTTAVTDKKKTKESFMRLGDIEGQEFEKSGSESSGSGSEDDEPEDEDAAERMKKKGMGFELSSFNMREEMEEGKFTDDGSYIRSFDAHAVHDKWMDGVDDRAIKQAKKRKKQQDRIQKQRIIAEERELEQTGGKPALETALLSKLKRGESVLEALQRLGKARKAKPKPSDDAMSVDAKPAVASDIESITHIASTLMSLGDTDIYSKTYEELVRSVRSSATMPEDWSPPSADAKYEYRWNMPGAGMPEDIFGPFGEDEMKAWFKASYFGPTGEKVKVREVGGDWADWDDVIF